MGLKISDLQFEYPENLIGLEPQRPSRVMWVEAQPQEISVQELLQKIPAGDVLVVNNTKVLKRRIFARAGEVELEILFLSQKSATEWEVLFPSKKIAVGEEILLPKNIRMQLIKKGRPQVIATSEILTEEYFNEVAELPLPPYIQKSRGQRHTQSADNDWYQTAWAKAAGSLAAPTASLHFTQRDLTTLKSRGVKVIELTLHVGLGTFLPVTSENLDEHLMHEELVEIPAETWQAILQAQETSRGIWAMGTTVARALESAALGLLPQNQKGDLHGLTRLLIQPGFRWQVVTGLLTNFHQPESTLLALVAGFSSLNQVKQCYAWAIEKKFRLFSYGDLTAWVRKNE